MPSPKVRTPEEQVAFLRAELIHQLRAMTTPMILYETTLDKVGSLLVSLRDSGGYPPEWQANPEVLHKLARQLHPDHVAAQRRIVEIMLKELGYEGA